MGAITMTQQTRQIYARLDEIDLEEKQLQDERRILLSELRNRPRNKKNSKQRPSIELTFIQEGRIIRWNGGELKLGEKKKQYWLILKTIYESKNHYASIAKLERKVWNFEPVEGNLFMDKFTIFMATKRVIDFFKENSFLYNISPIKSTQNQEVKGYKLSVKGLTVARTS
jgi:hypothetical protein